MRRQAAKREAGAKNGWIKREALRLLAIRDETGMTETGAVGGNKTDLLNADSKSGCLRSGDRHPPKAMNRNEWTSGAAAGEGLMGVIQHPRHWLFDVAVDGRCLMVLTDGALGREISLHAWVRVAEDPVVDEKARSDEPIRFSVTDFSEDAWLCVLDPQVTSRRLYGAPMGGSGQAIRLFKGNSVGMPARFFDFERRTA